MTRILGCDPGKASGLAVYNLDTGTVDYMEESPKGVQGFAPAFRRIHGMFQPTYVVCESFNLRSGNKFLADLSGVESIGWLRGEEYDVEYVTPSAHKTLVKDVKITPLMKSEGFKVGEGHTRDALRTAIWYACKVLKHRPTLEMLKPRATEA